MKYAISDVHGKYELFLKLLEKIEFSSVDTLYILGDVVDGIKENLKKPKDVEILKYIILETEELRKIHIFLSKLPYYIFIDGYILCHGGFEIPYDNIKIEEILKYQEKEKIVWPREGLYKNKNKIENTKIIFGHTNVKSIDSDCTGIWKNEENDKIGIDTSCFEIPTIACINLDNLTEIIVK